MMRIDSGAVGEDREVQEMSSAQALGVLVKRLYAPTLPATEIRIEQINNVIRIETFHFEQEGTDFFGGGKLNLLDVVNFEGTVEESLPLMKLVYVVLCNHQRNRRYNSSYTVIVFLEESLADYAEYFENPNVRSVYSHFDLTSELMGLQLLAVVALGYSDPVNLGFATFAQVIQAHDLVEDYGLSIEEALSRVPSEK